jgi:hypothetical protein
MVFLYRINGGEVLGVSTSANAYQGVDSTYFATATDPAAPDGVDLSTPKIWDGTKIRNATQAEVSNFPTARTADQNLIDRGKAIEWLQSNPVQRKILRALVSVLVDEINILRTQPTTSFSARTNAQAFTAIINKINSGSFD